MNKHTKELLYLGIKKINALVFFLGLILVLTGCTANSNDVVITVNGEDITVNEFDFYLKTVKTEMETKAAQENIEKFWDTEIDGEKATEVAKDKALEAAILNIVQLQKASEMGLGLTEEDKTEVTNRKNAYIDSIGGEENYKKNLEEAGLNDEVLTKLLEDDIIIQKLYQKISTEDEEVQVSEEEVRKYYDDNYEQFATGEQVRAKHILFSILDENNERLPDEEIAKIKKKAEGILYRVKNGEDFDELMKQYSEDPGLSTNPDGYYFGQDGQMAPEFEDAAFSLEVGEISELVETEFGFHIIKVEEKFDHMPYDNVKSYIKSTLLSNNYMDIVNSWKDEAQVDTNDKVLDKILVNTEE
jgi:foldase protein PrsA